MGAFPLIMGGVSFGGSAIGSPKVIREMLDLAAKQQIHPWIKKIPLKEANQVSNSLVGIFTQAAYFTSSYQGRHRHAQQQGSIPLRSRQ